MKRKAYIIGVSGGPDSMALLHLLKNAYYLVCAHVNYHFRPEAEQESALVATFCKENGIIFKRHDCYYKEGNFEDWARKERYHFYGEVVKETGIKEVLLAHHLDDHLETFLMQKFKGINVSYWGLKQVRQFNNYFILRPLLAYTKQELLTYCCLNNVPYALDSSNFNTAYTRNCLRYILKDLSINDKLQIQKYITYLNKEKESILAKCKAYLKGKQDILISSFLAFPYQEECLRLLLYNDLSNKELITYLNLIKTKKQVKCPIANKVLALNYGYLEVYDKVEPFNYQFFSLNDLKKTKHFFFSDKGKKREALIVDSADFPLTFRSVKKGDRLRFKFGHKKICRYFIDHKITYQKRDKTFVVCDKKGEIIFVSGIGSNYQRQNNKASIYCISSIIS